ncbi:MAG: exodeoxyribonuclease VII large subunit [Bacteroidetes bacterium HGW-Bacteroidetes-21]|nr:MAG: exodeoxyribonuclease VII large subunit [Bacteroidetes bacterium HGW-Bacteroidetes-21]
MSDRNYLSLIELNSRIKTVLESNLETYYWVVAEISEMSESRSGHCYLELIQKDNENDNPVAKAKATIWAGVYRMIKPYFSSATGHSLEQGINILVRVTVRYHEVYGLALNITDIEPAYTLGDIEMQRQETIKKLVDEGIFELNSQLPISVLPKKIAVISSPSAAGYGDFIRQLNENDYGIDFKTVLFPAFMQGADAVSSMIKALEKIFHYASYFDVVVIIRGGGSRSELMCFDSYELASHVCQFPLPVFSGIGHERDVSVVDLVAHSRFKTPTATAQFFIDSMLYEISAIDTLTEGLMLHAKNILDEGKAYINSSAVNIKSISSGYLKLYAQSVSSYRETIRKTVRFFISVQNNRQFTNIKSLQYQARGVQSLAEKEVVGLLDSLVRQPSKIVKSAIQKTVYLQKIVELTDPGLILKRGFSMTLLNGKMVKDVRHLVAGDKIQTRVFNGTIESEVKSTKKQ